MGTYSVRRATLADADTLAGQRVRMFADMGVLSAAGADAGRVSREFRRWLDDAMTSGTYVAWLVDHVDDGGPTEAVAGGGATIIPWPPGPNYPGSRLAFVYNVYTEPAHRGRGLARRVMETIHEYCRAEGIGSVALNASTYGQPLYESMGYRVAPSPMMFLSVGRGRV